jgi:hypothetical protein
MEITYVYFMKSVLSFPATILRVHIISHNNHVSKSEKIKRSCHGKYIFHLSFMESFNLCPV